MISKDGSSIMMEQRALGAWILLYKSLNFATLLLSFQSLRQGKLFRVKMKKKKSLFSLMLGEKMSPVPNELRKIMDKSFSMPAFCFHKN